MSDEILNDLRVAVARMEEQVGTIKSALLGNGGPGLMVRMSRIENRYAKGLGYAVGASAVAGLAASLVVEWMKAK